MAAAPVAPRRPLGRCGIEVPAIGLGTVKLGRNTDVKYPDAFALPDDDAVAALLARALELGVDLIDTAPAYGTAEQRLAGFVAAERERIVLCSKAGERYDAEAGSRYDFCAGDLRASVGESLATLGCHRLDLLLLHSDGRDTEILGDPAVAALLCELREAGQARAVGISAKTAEGIDAAVACGLDVVMTGFSQADPSRADALARAHAAGLGTLAIKGLASGHASDPAAAIRWVLGHDFIDALVIGTRSPAHLEDAVRAACDARA